MTRDKFLNVKNSTIGQHRTHVHDKPNTWDDQFKSLSKKAQYFHATQFFVQQVYPLATSYESECSFSTMIAVSLKIEKHKEQVKNKQTFMYLLLERGLFPKYYNLRNKTCQLSSSNE